MIVETGIVRFEADTSGLRKELDAVGKLANRFAGSLSTAFDQVVFKGRDLSDVLRGIALRLSSSAFHAAFRPVEQGLAGLLTDLVGGLVPGGRAVGAPRSLLPFADGGVVSGPSLFQAGRGLGLVGEAGPEAILPLSRGADGRLGVKARGSAPVTVNVSIRTPDAESFSRARGRVAADLARAVERGRRHL